ncbi:hypothetical protein D3C71_1231110 [compost metagenome]
MAAITRDVVSCSIERWNLLFKFAAVKCTRPSALSADGETVAALAVHIQDAELNADNNAGEVRIACSITLWSSPRKPNLRKVGTCGRSCGANTPCFKPMSAKAFIFNRPCLAANFGLERLFWFLVDASFPKDNPA